MLRCQLAEMLVKKGLKLSVEPNQILINKWSYWRLMGRLMYPSQTRPYLVYALIIISQYMHDSREQHMNAVMRILSLKVSQVCSWKENFVHQK